MSEEREIIFWQVKGDIEEDDVSGLHHKTIGDAVRAFASQRDNLPLKVEVNGFAEMAKPTVSEIAEHVVEETEDWIDLDLGDPEGYNDRQLPENENVKAAATQFAEAVDAAYTSWACEIITTKEVATADHTEPTP